MIADAVDHHRADSLRDIREAILDRQDNAVVQRIALGRAVEADGHDRARFLDLQQRGGVRSPGSSGVYHGIYYVLCRIVITYNYFGSQSGSALIPSLRGAHATKQSSLPSLTQWIASRSLSSGAATRWLAMTGKTSPHN